MSSEPTYFVLIAGEERGPYPLAVLRELRGRGLLAQDSCRDPATGGSAPLSDVLGTDDSDGAPRAGSFPVRYGHWYFGTGNSYRLRGSGTAAIAAEELTLTADSAPGALVTLPLPRIHDASSSGTRVTFKVDPEAGGGEPLKAALKFETPELARAFRLALPARLSPPVARDLVEAMEFESAMAKLPRPWLTPALVAVNFLIYLWAGMQGGWWTIDGRVLLRLGSNYGPYTADGNEWRLLTAIFLHGGFVHLAINMLALYDVGRVTERLLGTARFALLYLVSGILGSAVSVWWNPGVNSVGASGAIFGVLGATLVYMLDRRNGVPLSIMKAHQGTILVFILYALAFGLAKAGIDNAAHLGGLAAGLLLGWAFARPLDRGTGADTAPLLKSWKSAWRPAAGLAAVTIAFLTLTLLTPNLKPGFELEQRFLGDLAWLRTEESALIADSRQVFGSMQQPAADPVALKAGMAHLVSRWDRAYDRFAAYRLSGSSRLQPMHEDLLAYLDLRRRAMVVAAEAVRAGHTSSAHKEEFARLMKEGDATIARIKERNR
jgi:rhomboid protease GluP